MSDDKFSSFERYMMLRDLDPQMAGNLYKAAIKKASGDKDNRFIIQVGAYQFIENANIMIKKLKDKYMYAYIEREDNLNKVRIFGIKTKAEGYLIMEDIYDKFQIQPFLLNAS